MLLIAAVALVLAELSSGLHLKDDSSKSLNTSRRVIDMVIFNGEQDMFSLRVNELGTIVDLFLVFEGNCTFSGSPKKILFDKSDKRINNFSSRIRHVVVPCFGAGSAWSNEEMTRSYIQKAIKGMMSDRSDPKYDPELEKGAFMLSDVDEVPVAEKLKAQFETTSFWASLDEFHVFKVCGPLFYYNSRCLVDTPDAARWKGTRIFSGGLMARNEPFKEFRDRLAASHDIEPNLTSDNLRADSSDQPGHWKFWVCYDDDPFNLFNHGWHFSYFMADWEIQYKIKSFSHQEFNKPQFTYKQFIRGRQANCIDPFDRPDQPQVKLPVGQGSKALPLLPAYLKEAASDGRLPAWWLTGSY